MAKLRKALVDDDKTEYRLSGTQSFTADAGVKGTTFLAQSTDRTVRTWVVAQGNQGLELVGRAVPTQYATVEKDFEDMALSTKFAAAS